jgi:HEAT repeat protein
MIQGGSAHSTDRPQPGCLPGPGVEGRSGAAIPHRSPLGPERPGLADQFPCFRHEGLGSTRKYGLDAVEGAGIVVLHRAQRAALKRSFPEPCIIDATPGRDGDHGGGREVRFQASGFFARLSYNEIMWNREQRPGCSRTLSLPLLGTGVSVFVARRCQRQVEDMLDLRQLHKHILALDDGDDTLRRQALQSLRDHDEQEWATAPMEVSDALVKVLQGQLLNGMKQPLAQKEVATILGNMGPRSKPALPQLIELLHEDVPGSLREAAVTALGKIGKEASVAVDQLVQLVANSRPALSVQAVRALGNIGCADDGVRSVLVNLWLSPLQPQSGKAQVAIALCRLHISAHNLFGTLTRTLVEHQDADLRKAAAEALAWCSKDDTDVVPALLTASLSDTKEAVRQMAQAGLDHMRLSHEKAIRLCSRQLGDSCYAEGALRKSGQLAVPALIEALGAEEPAIRVKAARTLGCLGEAGAEAAPALTTALHDNDPDVRLAAAKGLWNTTKTADVVVPALVDLLKAKGADLEAGEARRRFLQTVMEALGRIGPPATAAVSALTAMAKDNNRHLRETALTTLQKIAPAVANKTGLRR